MDKIEVSKRARDAVADYSIKWTGLDEQAANRIKDGLHDPYSLVQAFARFERDILATRTDATPVAWIYYAEDGQEATPPFKNRLVPNTMGWTEVPLYTHPPATDVAALVEAAKEVSDRAFMTYRRNGRDHYIEDDSGEGCMIVPHDAWNALRAALAPFTKGPKP